MITRGANNKELPINVVGSSVFGRYDKISTERTMNMFISDTALVPYAGYQIEISATEFSSTGVGKEGRAIFSSIKFNCLVIVVDANVYLVTCTFNQELQMVQFVDVIFIGALATVTGIVYITENNKPQILFSDNINLYIYDPTVTPAFSQVAGLNFTPGYITFHDTYFIAAASQDTTYTPPANNTWRLSTSNEGYLNSTTFTSVANVITYATSIGLTAGSPITFLNTTILIPGTIYYAGNFSGNTFQVFATYANAINNVSPLATDASGIVGSNAWPSSAAYVGLLSTKPDNVQAVVRFPSKGNMIFVMGSIVTEAWFDTGAQLFPYQRNNQFNIDYGCLSPASVAYMDEIVVWLAQNEKSGPIIMYSDGGMPKKITTDGIDYAFSQLQTPSDSQGFLYRQDGHLFYHINFYSDNISYFYDFNTEKFFNASDQDNNYFIASEIAFYGNQYYFVTRNNGNLFAFDTSFTSYQDVESYPSTTVINYIIPRFRICKNIRLPSQDYVILNDIGFTIESGETDAFIQPTVPSIGLLLLQNGFPLLLQDGITDLQLNVNSNVTYTTPTVYLSLSYDGGATFANAVPYALPTIGYRRNRLMWWQCGMSNDTVPKFNMVSYGRVVCFDGIANVRI
jgi:hypothetical protein